MPNIFLYRKFKVMNKIENQKKEVKENVIKNNNVIVDMNLKIMKLQQIMSILFDLNNNQEHNTLYFDPEFFKKNSSKLVEIINDFDKTLFDKTNLKDQMKEFSKNEPTKQN